MTPLLELKNIRRSYPAGDEQVEVLKGITLDIYAGEMVAIVGASGSGKSTLMNILGCLDKATSGTYRVAGQDVATLDADALAQLRREHFGFIFQRYHLLSHLTAEQNVEVPAVYAGLERKQRLLRAQELLQRLGLEDRTEYYPAQLSGGQQRLAQTQAVSQQDLDTAATEMAVKQAQIGTIDAQIKRNQASLDTAKTNLDYTRIVAPMAGEVTQITTLQGQTVIAAQQAPNILTLADMSTMLVKAQVSEADVIHLKPGQKAWFTVLGDPLTRYEGQIKDVLPTPEKVNDAIFYYARFEVPNPNGLLRLDMTAQVHIQLTDVRNVLTIPLSALGDPVGDNRYKVKLLRNGETREREVTIGARNDTDVEIVKGLEAGDEVVIGEAKPGAAQ